MSDISVNDQATTDNSQNELLASLGRVYSFERSRETTKALSTFSFEDYLTMAKEQIKSSKKGSRSTKSQRLDQLEEEINKVVQRVSDLK